MKKLLLLVLISTISLFAYVDSDLDGVEDSLDRCPNSAMTDIVDIQGCPVKSLVSQHHFDVIVGLSYEEEQDIAFVDKFSRTTESLQIDYYYKNFSLQMLTSYYQSDTSYNSDLNLSDVDDSGMNDTTLAAYYQTLITPKLALRVGAGVILPTFDSSLNNEATDYLASVNLSYTLGEASLFAGYTYTMINDDDVGLIKYQDTNAFSGGLGYYLTPKLYSSISYFQSDSIYKGVDETKSASVYMFYSLSSHWFTTASYSKGLSDPTSDNYLALRVGYYF